MAKLNIFISQPMHGLSEREILAERDRIEEVLHKLFPNDELEFLSGYTSEAVHFQDETQERTCNMYNRQHIKEFQISQEHKDGKPKYRYEIQNFGGNRV